MSILALCFAVGQFGTLTRNLILTHNIKQFRDLKEWTVPATLMCVQTGILLIIALVLWVRPAGFVQALESANDSKSRPTTWGIQKLAFKIIGSFLILWGLGEMMDSLAPQVFFYHDTWVPYTLGPISIAVLGLLTLVVASVVPAPNNSAQGIIQTEDSSPGVQEEVKI